MKKPFRFMLIIIVLFYSSVFAQSGGKVINVKSGYVLIDTDFGIGDINEIIDVKRSTENGIIKIGEVQILTFHDGKTAGKIINVVNGFNIQIGDKIMIDDGVETDKLFDIKYDKDSMKNKKDRLSDEGWNKVKWGMSEQTVIEQYKSELKLLDIHKVFDNGIGYCNMTLEEIFIDGFSFEVNFVFNHESKSLYKVQLEHEVTSRGAGIGIFERIEKKLLEKYGKEILREKKEDPYGTPLGLTELKTIWNTSKTTIELHYYYIYTGEPIINFTIIYKLRPDSKDEFF